MMKEIEQTEKRFLLEKPDEPFAIKNDDEAMWAQKKIREKMAQKEANKAIAKDAADWAKHQNTRLDDSIAYFEGLLSAYVTPKYHADKTYKLVTPLGRVAYYKTRPEWEYDGGTLVKTRKQTGHGVLAKTETTEKLTITKTQLQNKFAKVNGHLVDKETGEVIDGIKYEERPKHIAFRFAKETDTNEDK